MVKVRGRGDKRDRGAAPRRDVSRAGWWTPTTESFIFELTGTPDKIDEFVDLMRADRPGRGVAHRRRVHLAGAGADLSGGSRAMSDFQNVLFKGEKLLWTGSRRRP